MLKEQLKLREWFIVLFLIGMMVTLSLISLYTEHRVAARIKIFVEESSLEAP